MEDTDYTNMSLEDLIDELNEHHSSDEFSGDEAYALGMDFHRMCDTSRSSDEVTEIIYNSEYEFRRVGTKIYSYESWVETNWGEWVVGSY